MARRRHEAEAEPLDVVERIVEGVDLQLAAVARPGIDFPNGERTAETSPRDALERRADLGKRGLVGAGCGFGQRAVHEAFKDALAHDSCF